jgi:hypothetical protein
MPEIRMFLLSAMMTSHNHGGSSVDVRNLTTYEITTDGEDAVVGRFTRKILENNPGFSLSENVSVTEVDREHLMLIADRMSHA